MQYNVPPINAQTTRMIPPQNIEAEQAVLGTILLQDKALLKIVELLEPEDFYRDAHKTIFAAMRTLFEKHEPHDLITVTGLLNDQNKLETIGGAACGALVPHKDYFKIVRQICDHYDLLLIADEVMCGFGRAGSMFAIERYNVIPDMMCTAKGMSAGYSPIGGVVVKEEIFETFLKGTGIFVHGHTYGGNPLSAAVSVAAIRTLIEDNLVENSNIVGEYLLKRLQETLLPFWFVGDVRGQGLMQGVELVRDKKTKEPFAVGLGMAEKLTVTLLQQGVVVYPGTGNADGENGDQFLLAPPLIITKDQADELVEAMRKGFEDFSKEIAGCRYNVGE